MWKTDFIHFLKELLTRLSCGRRGGSFISFNFCAFSGSSKSVSCIEELHQQPVWLPVSEVKRIALLIYIYTKLNILF